MARKVRCLSCRKLKIWCDNGKPKCEYCKSTNRTCVYPAPKAQKRVPSPVSEDGADSSPDSSNQFLLRKNSSHIYDDDIEGLVDRFYSSKLKEIEASSSTVSVLDNTEGVSALIYDNADLNSPYKQLGISRFKYRLLFTFQSVYITNMYTEKFSIESLSPMDKLWFYETPQLWHSSSTIRNCIYTMATMFLNSMSNLPSSIQDDIRYSESDSSSSPDFLDTPEYSLVSFPETRNGEDSRLDPVVASKDDITKKVLTYFEVALKENSKLLAKLMTNSVEITPDIAAESILASFLLFSFLSLQPYKIIQLINFNGSDTDIVKTVQRMKSFMFKTMPVVHNTKYHGILYYTEFEGLPTITDEYPVIKLILEQFHGKYKWDYDTSIATKIERSITLFNVCMFKSIANDDGDHIFRWIFLNDHDVFDLMEEKDYFCVKLLFYYSCYVLFSGFSTNRYDNVFIEYLMWFKTYTFSLFDNNWELEFDGNLYRLALQNFTLGANIKAFRDFSPEKYLINHDSPQT